MPELRGLIHVEDTGSLGFGDHSLATKSKVSDFSHQGDLYKVKSFFEITKLERNGLFAYESVPGSTVSDYRLTNKGIEFKVMAKGDCQITLGVEEDKEYELRINEDHIRDVRTGVGGKFSFVIELSPEEWATVSLRKKQAE